MLRRDGRASTCPENLRVVTEFSSWNIHPAYRRPYISLRVHPFSAFALFHLRSLLALPLPWRSPRNSDPSTNLADLVYRSKLKLTRVLIFSSYETKIYTKSYYDTIRIVTLLQYNGDVRIDKKLWGGISWISMYSCLNAFSGNCCSGGW